MSGTPWGPQRNYDVSGSAVGKKEEVKGEGKWISYAKGCGLSGKRIQSAPKGALGGRL